MSVLVDSSIWVTYFRTGEHSEAIDFLIGENLVSTNNLILTELVPYLKIQRQNRLIGLLNDINRYPILIDWTELQVWQAKCLRQGFNGIGIPDLIIAQNCVQNNAKLYSEDKHFALIKSITKHISYKYPAQSSEEFGGRRSSGDGGVRGTEEFGGQYT